MIYDTLKVLHILSATMVLTGIIYSCRLWFVNESTSTAKRIQIQTWTVIIPFAIFQLASGFTMISLKKYDLSELWITGSVLGFVIVICSWLGFLYFLISSPQTSSQMFRRIQLIMLILCNIALLCMIFLMVNKIT